MFASMTAAPVRLRTLAAMSVTAVLAAFALVAGPLATPSRAADVYDVEDFFAEIDAANAATEPYTITLQDDIAFYEVDGPAFLQASVDVTIDGNGHEVTCIDGEECDGWLIVDSANADASLEIFDIEVTLFAQAVNVNDTSITISDSTFESNGFTTDEGTEFGGSALYIYNGEDSVQSTTLDDVDFFSNEIVALDGCIFGGAAYIVGDLSITGGSFQDNRVAATTTELEDVCYVGGGALEIVESSFEIFGTSFEFNSAEGPYDDDDPFGNVVAGAVSVYESEGIFANVSFQDNDTDGLGGALHIQESGVTLEEVDVVSNTALYGGGVYAFDSYLTLDESLISENSADISGGGLFMSASPLRAEWTEFKGNSAEGEYGGAIEFDGWGPFGSPEDPVGDSEVLWSLFHGNSAPQGGAVDVYEAEVYFGATTFADNSGEEGAAILVEDARAELQHVTVARNTITSDDSAQLVADGGEIELEFSAVLEALGAGSNCGMDGDSDIDSDGFNATDDTSCDFDDFEDIELSGGDFDLGPLQFNGGPTWTMLPAPESPLVDAIPTEICDEQETPTEGMDQRSVDLEQWDGCDIGAAEIFEPVDGEVTTPGGAVYVRILNVEGAEGGHVDLSTLTPAPPAGVAFPYGGFEVGMEVWGDGWPADIQYFTPAPTNQLWKLFDGSWVQPPGATSENGEGGTLWTFRVFDGGFGDNDGETNSMIIDPFAAGVGAAFTG
jgi:hypothetical protein